MLKALKVFTVVLLLSALAKIAGFSLKPAVTVYENMSRSFWAFVWSPTLLEQADELPGMTPMLLLLPGLMVVGFVVVITWGYLDLRRMQARWKDEEKGHESANHITNH